MGFTPLAGVMMGTRSGDIDPSIIPYIMKHENLAISEVMEILNEKSGLLGISDYSSDMRDIRERKHNATTGNHGFCGANNVIVSLVALQKHLRFATGDPAAG